MKPLDLIQPALRRGFGKASLYFAKSEIHPESRKAGRSGIKIKA